MDFPSACEHNRIGAASRTSGWRKEFSVYLESEGLGLQSTARSSMEWHMRLPAISHMSYAGLKITASAKANAGSFNAVQLCMQFSPVAQRLSGNVRWL